MRLHGACPTRAAGHHDTLQLGEEHSISHSAVHRCPVSFALQARERSSVTFAKRPRFPHTGRVKNLLSADGKTVIQMGTEVQAGIDFKFVYQQVRLTIRDESGRLYQTRRLSEIGGGSPVNGDPFTGGLQRLDVEWTLDALAPEVRSVEVLLDAPAPLGNWTVEVPVVPLQKAGLPQAREVRSGLELHGITVGVTSVSASAEGTAVQLRAQADPQVGKVRSIGPLGLLRQLVLRDDRGREYLEKIDLLSQPPSLPRRSWSPGSNFTVLTEDLLFPPLASDARSAEVVVPFVVISEQSGDASLRVPIGGKKVGERIPLDANLTLGSYSFRVTHAEIVDSSSKQLPMPPGERRLVLQLDLGDWNGDRKLMGLGQLLLDGAESYGFSPSASDDGFGVSFPPNPNEGTDGQWKRVALVLPKDVPDQVTVTFRNADVAVQGPWRLQVPVGTER